MFKNCNSLTELKISNFNTTTVTSMDSIFSNCSSLTYLVISNFNTKSLDDYGSIDSFYNFNIIN